MYLIQGGQERPLRSQLIDSTVWFTAHTVFAFDPFVGAFECIFDCKYECDVL